MARGRRTGGRDFEKGHPKLGGRKPGTPNRIPAGFKATAMAVAAEIRDKYAGDVLRAMLDGIHAKPPVSHPYLTLYFAYGDGRPMQRFQVVDPQPIEIHLHAEEEASPHPRIR